MLAASISLDFYNHHRSRPCHRKIEACVAYKQYQITADILENSIEISVSKLHNGHQRRVRTGDGCLGIGNHDAQVDREGPAVLGANG